MNSTQPRFIRDSLELARQLLREQAIPLAIIFMISTAIGVVTEDQLGGLTKSEEDLRWILQLFMGITDLVTGVLLLLVLSWGIPKVRSLSQPFYQPRPFESNYLNSFLAEYLRLLGNVLLWGLLLLIPGFIRYCRLIFVPYITLFHRSYREGKTDAFRLAETLSQGRLRRIAVTVLASSLTQAGLEMLPELIPDLHNLVARLIFDALSFGISIWLYAFFFLQFEEALQQTSPSELESP